MQSQLSPETRSKAFDTPPLPFGTDVALGTTAITDKTHRVVVYSHSIRLVALLPASEPPAVRYGQKRKITHFTDKSRRNLSKILARVRWNNYSDVMFLTLTYHNEYPTSPHAAKIDLANFLKSLLYHFPHIDYLWKLEYQERGAPHFHIIVFFRHESISINPHMFQEEIIPLWLQQQGCGCNDCKLHSVRVDRVRSYRKCSYYVQKYISKESYDPGLEHTGRFWGKSQRLNIEPFDRLDITPNKYLIIRRMVHSLLSMRKNKNDGFLTWLEQSWSFEVFLTEDERKILQYWLIEIGIVLPDDSDSA